MYRKYYGELGDFSGEFLTVIDKTRFGVIFSR